MPAGSAFFCSVFWMSGKFHEDNMSSFCDVSNDQSLRDSKVGRCSFKKIREKINKKRSTFINFLSSINILIVSYPAIRIHLNFWLRVRAVMHHCYRCSSYEIFSTWPGSPITSQTARPMCYRDSPRVVSLSTSTTNYKPLPPFNSNPITLETFSIPRQPSMPRAM